MSVVYIRKIENIRDCLLNCWNEIKSSQNTPINSVLIKPNFVNDLPANRGVTTSFEVIDSVIKFLHEQEIHNIAISEASILDTETVFNSLDIYSYEKKGVRIINLERCERVTVSSPLGLSIKNFSIPDVINDYDLIINIPKMKTHILTGVSLGLKNLFAFFSRAGRKFAHVTDIDLAIVEMYSYIKSSKPILTVMDATVAMSGKRGPIHGNAVKLGIVLAGCDAVAVDAAAVDIMGSKYENIRHIALAVHHKLGNVSNVDCVDIDITNIKKQFVVPAPSMHFIAKLVALKNFIFRKSPILEFPLNCTKCLSCIRICPKNCIKLENDKISIDYTNCVSCLCCCEACKYNAMGHSVRFGIAYKFLLLLKRLYIKYRKI